MEVQLRGIEQGIVPLGRTLQLVWDSSDPSTEVRIFVQSGAIHYTKPLVDWNRLREIRIFLEAPGQYALIVQWRGRTEQGERTLPFEMRTDDLSPLYGGPTRVALEDFFLWAPSDWEGRVLAGSEQDFLQALRSRVQIGDCVYDIGANLGLFSLNFSAWVGPAGRVYSFEPNPACLSCLQSTLMDQACTNIEVFPVAVTDRSEEVPFTLNYGNANLGVTSHSHFFESKLGQTIKVEGQPLDGLCRDLGIRAPRLVKIDVEGGETAALRGMRDTLASHRPTVAIELHGHECAKSSFDVLDSLAYFYTDLCGDRFESSESVLNCYGDRVFQILALPSPVSTRG